MGSGSRKVLVAASVASMIDQFNMSNIRLLQEMGYEVHVACNYKKGNTCDAKRIGLLQETLRDLHVVQHQWDCPRDLHSIRACVQAYRQIRELLKRQHYQWIHCHSPVGGVLARLAAHPQGIRTVYTAHGFHFFKGAPFQNWLLYYPVEKLLAHWTDVLITINHEDYCFAVRRLNAGRICYIPGVGIDTEKFQMGAHKIQNRIEDEVKGGFQNRFVDRDKNKKAVYALGRKDPRFGNKYRIPEGAAVLLSVGELNKGKNHRMVIKALAELARKDVYYVICGQGPLHARLRRYACRLGVGRYLRLLGYQEDMPWIYQNADIFIFPSKREGMPVALMEAMAAGLPCVASQIRGNRELAEKRMLFSLKKPQQLADRLELLLEDACLRKECSRYALSVIKKYDQEVVLKRMRKIYESVGGRVVWPMPEER